MTFSFLWFAVGVAVGVMVALAGLWWSLRRENRKVALKVERRERLLTYYRKQYEAANPAKVVEMSQPLASRRADP